MSSAMTPDDQNGDEKIENISLSPRYDLSTAQRLALVIERQNNLLHRVRTLEKKAETIGATFNKAAGALALVAGVGVFIGWLLSVSGHIASWFR
jgi:hypothetical protein